MAEYQENSIKFLSDSSLENKNSIDSSNAEVDGGDGEFYEKIEAPKFVDFTLPDHYCPDDHYWFCHRVGCDQKHEEEMDSETIYKNFVLRVMAARSPNVRFQKALDRNASRTPIKCPLSAPPKSSKPRLSRMALISSISKKMVDDKKRVVKPLSKSGSTPLTKMKPVAAKYLTTPRNKKCISNQNSFRSVRNPKPNVVEGEKSRMVAKALVFHSPKKAIKVKTSVELRTPISKLCEGMNKLEISSQRKHALGFSSKSSKNLSDSLSRRQLSSLKVQRKNKEPLCSQTSTNQEAKSGRSIKTKIKGQLSQEAASRKLLRNDRTCSLQTNEICDVKQESTPEETCMSSTVPPAAHNSDLASRDDSKREVNCLDIEGSDDNLRSETKNSQENNLRAQPTNRQEDICTDGNDNGNRGFTTESSGEFVDQINANNSSEGERNGHEFMDGDDKENAAASDENRIPNNYQKQNGQKIFGVHEKSGQVKKKVTQTQDKNLKEGSSVPVMKLKKPKATNPRPFRLRTDERRILREANLEKRTEPLAAQSESTNLSTPSGKLQRKQGNDIQKGSILGGLKTPEGQEERSKAAALMTPESKKHQARKLMNSPCKSNAMQRLEKFKKITSPLSKHSVTPQGGPVSTKQEMISYLIPGKKLEVIHEASPEVSTKQEMISYLIPGKQLEVIHEASPEVSEPRRLEKPTGIAPAANDAAASPAPRSSSHGRRSITVAAEPNFHSLHVPRSCTKKNRRL